jgi:predicted amidohydrolase YtcJ
VECGVYPEHLDTAIARGLASGELVEGTGGLVTQGPLKVITDGSLGTRTAYCDAAYPGLEGSPNSHGMLVVPPEELLPLLRRGCAHGLIPAVHAIGDHANALALDTFSRLGAPGRIEHAQLLRPGDADRFAALGVAASVQPAHCPDDRDIADRYWPTTVDLAFPYRTLHDAGVTLLFGSDAPVAPLDPWLAIAASVRRTADDREPWHPEQHLPVSVALQASVRGDLPLLAGAPADLAVLDVDPLAVPTDALADVQVHATMLAGRWTWHADLR